MDTVPSGAILESEFARDFGLSTLFIRSGTCNCFLSLEEVEGCSELKCGFSGDCKVWSSTEMLYSHVGTLFVTVILKRELLEAMAGNDALKINELMSDFEEAERVLECALEALEKQFVKRTSLYKRLREMRYSS
ncbi:hypothetical protein EYM_01210 [Ignicoccus islandicus DSM 13165]|uniref:Uncharacterized protein n=1 Tax=Ignicoccus islandicus DSM 13165 TaxID=940295 RepID=A0A0U2MAF9_9CREN|nr:hypothetical protein EYM_01210 [Ignicoccus islandicus DSM 13165]